MFDLHYRTPNEVKQDYAPRISQQKWHSYESTIRDLHDRGKTRTAILENLAKVEFLPTLAQLNAQMGKWKLKVYGKTDPVPTEDDHVVTQHDLPEEPSLDLSQAAYPMDTIEDHLESLPEIVHNCDSPGRGICHYTLRLFPNPCSEMMTVKNATMVLHEVHHIGIETPLLMDPFHDAPEVSMETISSEPYQAMSECGYSVASHHTRSTFATHASDTSSLRDFRSTATRVHKASKLRSQLTEGISIHAEEITGMLNSWQFRMADANMFIRVYRLVDSATGLLGLHSDVGRVCRSIYPSCKQSRLDRPLPATMVIMLSPLLAHVPSQRDPGLPTDPWWKTMAKDSVATEFGDFFAKELCTSCMVERLNRLEARPNCSSCDLPVDNSATGWTTLVELAKVFGDFYALVDGEKHLFKLDLDVPNQEDFHRMYSRIKALRIQLLRSHDLYAESLADVPTDVLTDVITSMELFVQVCRDVIARAR